MPEQTQGPDQPAPLFDVVESATNSWAVAIRHKGKTFAWVSFFSRESLEKYLPIINAALAMFGACADAGPPESK